MRMLASALLFATILGAQHEGEGAKNPFKRKET
jgi:hypothetical protein